MANRQDDGAGGRSFRFLYMKLGDRGAMGCRGKWLLRTQ